MLCGAHEDAFGEVSASAQIPQLPSLASMPTEIPLVAADGLVSVGGGVPALSSSPAAGAVLYLDFDGDSASTWGSYSVPQTPAYDRDGDPSTFSDGELDAIRNVWARVAEKYSPFDINVTTQNPGSLVNQVALRVVVGGSGSWAGSGYGGIGYVGGFYNASPNTVYAFEDNLGNGEPLYTAEAISHESGHGFGLDHQSAFSGGTKTAEYYRGDSLRAPIMGNSYYAQRGLWWKGTSANGSVQDDLSILSGAANGFGYRADDHGNALDSATSLLPSGSTLAAAGIVSTVSDLDYFSFATAGGAVSLSAGVAAQGATLDLRLELRDASGGLVASSDTSTLGEDLAASVSAGTYYVVVASHGGYGDVGQYALTGSVTVPEGFVATPAGLAVAATPSHVSLSWTDRSDNETGFVVERSTDGGSSWQISTTLVAGSNGYTDVSIEAGITYAYRVYALGAAGRSEYSNTVTITPVSAPPTELVAAARSSSRIDLAWSDVSGESGYRIERSSDGLSGWESVGTSVSDVTTFSDTSLPPGGTFFYRIRSIGAAADSDPSNIAWATTTAVVTTPPAAPSGVTALFVSKNKVRVGWTDNSSDETGFVLERSADGVTWAHLATLGADVTGYTEVVRHGQSYHYRVAAYNGAGQSQFAAAASSRPARGGGQSAVHFSAVRITGSERFGHGVFARDERALLE